MSEQENRTTPSAPKKQMSANKKVATKKVAADMAASVKKKKVKKKRPAAPKQKPIPLDPRFEPVVDGSRSYVDLDRNRPLTKKERTQLEKFSGDTGSASRDEVFAAAMASVKKQTGHDCLISSRDLKSLIIGIEINCLPLEYLFDKTGFPLNILMQIVGKPGALKTSLLFEIYRMFFAADGGAFHVENESKMSETLFRSILRLGPDQRGPEVAMSDSLDRAQQLVTYSMQALQKHFTGTKENVGPGRTIPVCWGVDSAMGKLAEESQKKILKDGSAGRSHALEALSWTNYLKVIPNQMVHWPFCLILINHMKEAKNEQGFKERKKAGGHQITFQEGLEIESKVVKTNIVSAEFSGVGTELRCYKNSFGQGNRRIQTRMLWRRDVDEETGEQRQKTWFDWGWATINLLNTVESSKFTKLKKELGLHLSITNSSMVENKCWSSNLGMKKEDAASWAEVGERINQTPELLDKWRTALEIERIPYLRGDFGNQVNSLLEKAEG